MKEEIQQRIDEIMDTFDFDQVHKMMTAVDWTWWMGPEARVPDQFELRQAARKHLRQAVEGKGWVGSGGFAAYYDEWEEGFNLWLFWGPSVMDEPVEWEHPEKRTEHPLNGHKSPDGCLDTPEGS